MSEMRAYEGGCHCGRVRFRIVTDLKRVSQCNCSICVKKGILHHLVPPERFELLSGADDLVTYRFNTGVAKHTFCRHCGIHPFYVPRSDPDMIDVNVRCLDEVDAATLKLDFFDGRNWEQAIDTWHHGR
jgi:hypothetical protein